MTKEEHNDLLEQIARSGGDTEHMLELIKKLQDAYDEREGELARYREKYDGENAKDKVREDDKEDYRSKYEELRKNYIDRFFGKAKDEIMEETKEDVKRDGEFQTYEELFERREGGK